MTIKYRYQLVELMKHLGLPLIAVEVGVASGLFSRELLDKGVEKLFSADNWQHIPNIRGDGNYEQDWHDYNYGKAKELLTPFGEKSIMLKGLSHDMAKYVPDNSCGLIYLDGDHSYNGVMIDLHSWFPKLVSAGIMATHDYLSPAYGTKQAFEEFTKANGIDTIYDIPEDKEEDSGALFFKP